MQQDGARRPIVLVGLSGSGKTTVAHVLATRLAAEMLDTDVLVAAVAGQPLPEIFAHRGERDFRAMEEGAIAYALYAEPAVIATGGGAVLSENSRYLMRQRGFVVWLDAPDDDLLARLRADAEERPLLAEGAEARLADLRRQRTLLYAEAAHLRLIGRAHV